MPPRLNSHPILDRQFAGGKHLNGNHVVCHANWISWTEFDLIDVLVDHYASTAWLQFDEVLCQLPRLSLSLVTPPSLDKLFGSQPEPFRRETLLTEWTEATVFSLHTYSVDYVGQSQKPTIGLALSLHTFRSCEINFNSDAGRGPPPGPKWALV